MTALDRVVRARKPRSKSGFKGVKLIRDGKWAAMVIRDYQTHHLGFFETAEEAARAYDAWVLENSPEGSCLNFSWRKS